MPFAGPASVSSRGVRVNTARGPADWKRLWTKVWRGPTLAVSKRMADPVEEGLMARRRFASVAAVVGFVVSLSIPATVAADTPPSLSGEFLVGGGENLDVTGSC